jgi:hypothetical protein
MDKMIRALLLSACVGLLGVATQGCAGTEVRAEAGIVGPSLAYVSPGLWVVTDVDDPIFYHDDLYWLYRGGRWYSSPYYSGGWAYTTTPRLPVVIRTIRRPTIYHRYRAIPGQRVRRAPHRRITPRAQSRRRVPPRRQAPRRSRPPRRSN